MPNDATQPTGAFYQSLVRNNAKIRQDRALTIFEDASLIYRREVEDLAFQVKKMRRDQAAMLDLSPTDADSLVLASDFDAKSYVATDVDLAVKIRNTEIKYQLAKERYEFLFSAVGLHDTEPNNAGGN